MAIVYPYPLTFLADLLPIRAVEWSVERFDQVSGTGDSRFWQSELADPLWRASIALDIDHPREMEKIAALIRKLHGAQYTFWLYDPVAKYPAADPDGTILGTATVQVHTVGTEKHTLKLKGLPAGYQLTLADKLQISFSDGQTYFGEIDETVAADGTGVTPFFEIFPHVPPGVAANDAVTLIRPACKVFVLPGTHKPGTARTGITDGAQLEVMERRR